MNVNRTGAGPKSHHAAKMARSVYPSDKLIFVFVSGEEDGNTLEGGYECPSTLPL